MKRNTEKKQGIEFSTLGKLKGGFIILENLNLQEVKNKMEEIKLHNLEKKHDHLYPNEYGLQMKEGCDNLVEGGKHEFKFEGKVKGVKR